MSRRAADEALGADPRDLDVNLKKLLQYSQTDAFTREGWMMNSNPKLEMHPDAESLNAFAEQALGEQEREQIVAHLAECGRCREVVFWRGSGAEEMAPELAAAAAARQS